MIACGLAADYSEVCLSFIRIFDTNSHDPARSSAEKRDFIETLRRLFLDGLILAKVDEQDEKIQRSSAGQPVAKTLTQIAYEQLLPMRVFYYGHKTKVLWSSVAKEEAKAAMRSIQDVARAACARVNADLFDDDPLVMLDVFNLQECIETRAMIRSGCHAAAESGRKRADRCCRRVRKLAEHLKLENPAAVVHEFTDVMPVVLRTLARLQKLALARPLNEHPRPGELARSQPPAKSDGPVNAPQRLEIGARAVAQEVDNRSVWAAILEPELRSKYANLALLVRFYLSVQDTTGLLERGLGAAMHLTSSHGGPMDESCETLSDMLHVFLDGPRGEAQMFARGLGGTLLLTPFSRSCQREWIMRHGRRFACNLKQRKNAKVRQTGWRFAGSDRAVQLGQRLATSLQKRMADRGSVPTFFGDTTAEYVDAGRGTPHALRSFRLFTNKRLCAKRVRAAAGCSGPARPPTLRRAAAADPLPLAKSATKAGKVRETLLAKVRQGPASVFVHGPPLDADLAAAFRAASLKTAELVVVPALTDLDTKVMDARDLLVWLAVIAAGKSLVARPLLTRDTKADSETCLRHEAARRFKQFVGLCADFARAQPQLAGSLREHAAADGSKWHVKVGAGWTKESVGGPIMVNSLSTLQSFLRRARRIWRARSTHGTYCKRSAAVRDR